MFFITPFFYFSLEMNHVSGSATKTNPWFNFLSPDIWSVLRLMGPSPHILDQFAYGDGPAAKTEIIILLISRTPMQIFKALFLPSHTRCNWLNEQEQHGWPHFVLNSMNNMGKTICSFKLSSMQESSHGWFTVLFIFYDSLE